MQKSSINITNKVVLIINLLLNLITVAGYVVEVLRGGRTLGYVLTFALIIFTPMLIGYITYRKNPSSGNVKYITLIGYLFFYSFVSLT